MDAFLQFDRKKRLAEQLLRDLRKEKDALEDEVKQRNILISQVTTLRDQVSQIARQIEQLQPLVSLLKDQLSEEVKKLRHMTNLLRDEEKSSYDDSLLFIERTSQFIASVFEFIKRYDNITGTAIQSFWNDMINSFETLYDFTRRHLQEKTSESKEQMDDDTQEEPQNIIMCLDDISFDDSFGSDFD